MRITKYLPRTVSGSFRHWMGMIGFRGKYLLYHFGFDNPFKHHYGLVPSVFKYNTSICYTWWIFFFSRDRIWVDVPIFKY